MSLFRVSNMVTIRGDFEFTPVEQKISNLLWAVTSGVGGGLCFLVLLVIAVTMIHPASRHQLDRVSFRIMIYALTANMIFGVASAVCGSQKTDGFGCGFSMWLLMLTLEISTFLLFSIGLNLQLVLVHGVNGQMMEKYYIIASILLGVAITVPPYAMKQYGWDPLNQACWYTAGTTAERLKWQIGTQLFWTGFCAFGEVLMFGVVLWHMVRHQVLHGAALRSRSRSRSLSTGTRGPTMSSGSVVANRPVNHVKTYQGVIIRIALYPIASLIINCISIVSDLIMTTSTGVETQTEYNILLLNDFCYGGRPIVYALLAITDPAFLRAIKSLYRHMRGHRDDSTNTSTGGPTTQTRSQITVHIALKEVRQLDDGTIIPSTPPMKASGDQTSSAPDFMLPGKDEEEANQTHDYLDSDDRAVRLEGMRRAQIGRAMEMRNDLMERRQDRKDFKRQI